MLKGKRAKGKHAGEESSTASGSAAPADNKKCGELAGGRDHVMHDEPMQAARHYIDLFQTQPRYAPEQVKEAVTRGDKLLEKQGTFKQRAWRWRRSGGS